MSHSRKDQRGGHRKTDIEFRLSGGVVWGQSGKRYAKQFRSKLARRHGRVSIRDLEVLQPFDPWEEMRDFYDEVYGQDEGYEDPWTDFNNPDKVDFDPWDYDQDLYDYEYDYDFSWDY